MRHVVILGTGTQARVTYWCLQEAFPGTDAVFFDDVKGRTNLEMAGRSFPVYATWDFLKADPASRPQCEHFILGVGHPDAKRTLVRKARAAGLRPAPTIVHPRACVQGHDIEIGVGGLIQAQCVITAGAQIGDYVTLVASVNLGPLCRIGNYSTLYPGTCVAEEAVLGEACLVETGAAIDQNVKVADGTHIGAQSCVIKNITEPNSRVAGVPARLLK